MAHPATRAPKYHCSGASPHTSVERPGHSGPRGCGRCRAPRDSTSPRSRRRRPRKTPNISPQGRRRPSRPAVRARRCRAAHRTRSRGTPRSPATARRAASASAPPGCDCSCPPPGGTAPPRTARHRRIGWPRRPAHTRSPVWKRRCGQPLGRPKPSPKARDRGLRRSRSTSVSGRRACRVLEETAGARAGWPAASPRDGPLPGMLGQKRSGASQSARRKASPSPSLR